MNAFAAQAGNPWVMAAAVALGVSVPALVFALTKGRRLDVDRHPRPNGVASSRS